jgi:hypothetical protein
MVEKPSGSFCERHLALRVNIPEKLDSCVRSSVTIHLGIQEGQIVSVTVTGLVKNGVVVPTAPLPEGAQVEIRLQEGSAELPAEQIDKLAAKVALVAATHLSPRELRTMPREQRQAILATAAELAEQDYRTDKELTGFEAFSEEELNDDESNSQ